MKTLKITISLLGIFLFLFPLKTVAQNQMYTIHADYVKPAMEKEYVDVSKAFIAECKKYNLQDADWMQARLDNGTYITIEAIPNMAALDVNSFAPLADKMGKEKFQALVDRYAKCYDKHGSFNLSLIKDLSYMPDGATAAQEGMNYRKYHYLFVTPSTSKLVREKMKTITDLYVKKGSKEYFRAYHSGYGTLEEFFLVVISAKDEQSYAKQSDENDVLIGDEGTKLFDDLFKTVSRYEPLSGKMLPELSYAAKK
ncbi:hypothetical protein [Flavobacterium cellulosilyticum]|uniref:Uncharacterized protein n=1 Tax=Flavobacterium cellulosilyticum TaxID=2541731 RepID=A0A4R5CKQ8_9FLAO|nr:hypothetical protein [Flavobacterium cellulosilyticum]TDD98024.1 hypothetical protein E0F76_07975 [Flavobacterium cellulosilyticum]